MNKISEQNLILYHYRELPESELNTITRLLESEKSLQSQYQELTALLDATDAWQPPKQIDDFEQKVWLKVNAEIDDWERTSITSVVRSVISIWKKAINRFSIVLHHPVPAFALVLVLVSMAYYSGRYDRSQDLLNDPLQMIASLSQETREKILHSSVSEHLERSSRLFTTVSTTNSEQDDIANSEQKWARQLLISNRMFSKAAEQSEQWRIVSLLNELEPILIEMANSNEQTFSNRQQIQERIQNRKLVFKTKAFKAKQNQNI